MKFFLSVFILTISADIFQTCNIVKKGLSDAEKKEILKLHNEMRQKVASGQQAGQPTAANMNVLTWDDEVAAKAQKMTEQCNFNHDPDENRITSKYDAVGQNLYWSSDHGAVSANVKKAVENWYNEVTKYNVGQSLLKSFQDTKAGHYTQLIWADTKVIGCGFTAYPDTEKIPGNTAQIIACNYAPSGNYEDEPVYEFGSPCSKCKNGCSKTFSALCA